MEATAPELLRPPAAGPALSIACSRSSRLVSSAHFIISSGPDVETTRAVRSCGGGLGMVMGS